jgi:hypothetical protein
LALILSHDFQEGFFEGKALWRKFEDIHVGRNKVAEDFRQRFHGIGRKSESIVIELGGICPPLNARDYLLSKIVGAHMNLDFSIGRSAQVTGTDHFALFNKNYRVASDFDFAEKMRVEKDSCAAIAFVANDVTDEVAAHGIEAGRGFIKEDKFGFMDQSLSQTDALHHAF